MCCCVLQCVAVCFSVFQCVAVCCSVLRCVAECCSVLQYVEAFIICMRLGCRSVSKAQRRVFGSCERID